jgi:hypothetical protein
MARNQAPGGVPSEYRLAPARHRSSTGTTPTSSVDPEHLTCGVWVLTVFPSPPRGENEEATWSPTRLHVFSAHGLIGASNPSLVYNPRDRSREDRHGYDTGRSASDRAADANRRAILLAWGAIAGATPSRLALQDSLWGETFKRHTPTREHARIWPDWEIRGSYGFKVPSSPCCDLRRRFRQRAPGTRTG